MMTTVLPFWSLVWVPFFTTLTSSTHNCFFVQGFTISRSTPLTSSSFLLSSVITSEEADFDVDVKRGGVRLAEESAIQINGAINNNDVRMQDMIRYTTVTPVLESAVLSQNRIQILATGTGHEIYHDPGETTVKRVQYAPMEAVQNALSSSSTLGSAMILPPNAKIVVNFAGGNDLQASEVVDAIQWLADQLSIVLQFHSVSHASFPEKVVSVTILQVVKNDNDDNNVQDRDSTEEEKALGNGQLYVVQDSGKKYFTLLESSITTQEA